MKNKRPLKTKLIAVIISMVSAVSLIAVGVLASITKFTITISNQLDVKIETVEGNLYATRMGDVCYAGDRQNTATANLNSANDLVATNWLNLYDMANGGANETNIAEISKAVDFVSDDAVAAAVANNRTSVSIVYYFYYSLKDEAMANSRIYLTADAPTTIPNGLTISYAYEYTTSATLPDFTNGVAMVSGDSVIVDVGHSSVFIKAEAKVDLTKSVTLTALDWHFILNFKVSTEGTSGVVKIDGKPIMGNFYHYVELGEYPQTHVSDSATISALNSLTDSAKTSRSFTVGGANDAKVAYPEYNYSGSKYVKVQSAMVAGTGYKFTDGETVTNGNTYWFKVEPIKWYLLESYANSSGPYTGSTKNVKLISEKVLTANVMWNTVAGGTLWANSNVRSWLNDSFYNSAFSTADKAKIKTNLTRYNSGGGSNHTLQDDYKATSSEYSCHDNVWLLSYYEGSKTFNGDNMYFHRAMVDAYKGGGIYQSSTSEAVIPTDFALANRTFVSADGKNAASFWLRTAGFELEGNKYVGVVTAVDGGLGFTYPPTQNTVGVRPVIIADID